MMRSLFIYRLLVMLMLGMGTIPLAAQSVAKWLRKSAVSLHRAPEAYTRAFSGYRVIGLGEATHGQHEAFELKRKITMHLVREHGYRLVAYEASVSSAAGCNDYIAGRSHDRDAAVKALGMLIWQIEENAALLDDLRAWNQQAGPAGQVKFVGIDAQDGEAALQRLSGWIGQSHESLEQQARALGARSQAALQKLFSGEGRAALDSVLADLPAWEDAVRQLAPAPKADLELALLEWRSYLGMYATAGGRDSAMAALFLAQLHMAPAGTRCVIWGHNAHIFKGALAYMGSEEMAMGGHLARALGADYYAVGFTFGEGEFQANAREANGQWGFRRYRMSPAPEGSLDAQLAATGKGDCFVDLRGAPASASVQQWLSAGHGQRWWGGYNIPDDCDERTRNASQLLPTYPGKEYDALVFLQRTTAARPLRH